MTKASVSLLLASLAVGAPTSSRAGPVTWEYVNINFDIAVNSLNKMRRFAKACSLSSPAEQIAREFVINYSAKAHVSAIEVSQLVENNYALDPGALSPARTCEMKYVTFWTDDFRQRSQSLDEVLTQYRQQR
jgi:hypothetical protein